MVSHYEILGVLPTATAAEIRRAYRALAQRHHPDVAGAGVMPGRMEAVNAAWFVLGDARRRWAYDNEIGVEPLARPSPPVHDAGPEQDPGPERPFERDGGGLFEGIAGPDPAAAARRAVTPGD